MSTNLNLWLVHPQQESCTTFHDRFYGLANVRVFHQHFEDLAPHSCFVTAANSFGIMTADIGAAVVRYFGNDLMHRVQHHIRDDYFGEQLVGTAFILPTEDTDLPNRLVAETDCVDEECRSRHTLDDDSA